MTIRLWNTPTRTKQPVLPDAQGRIGMYVCGPTVYDRAHLGNARPVVVFDVLYRLLRHVHGAGAVTYVRNFTDIDDKINARATATGRPIRDITDETIGWYLADMAALGALPPDHMPRATDYVAQMIAMIARLQADGFAYAAQGHVLFRVRRYAEYGALSGRSLDDMIAGARVEVAPYKEDPLDFVLWKPSTPDLPGWDSPWGRGRPGWHIECSAMARDLLGGAFQIHGGGIDLQFPHHENEIAQSRCAHPGEPFAGIWVHNEMLLVEGKKMSKSLGNFFTVRDLLDRGVPGEVIRYVMLMTHYRSPMDWTEAKAREAENRLDALLPAMKIIADLGVSPPGRAAFLPQGVRDSLSEDLDTYRALQALHGEASLLEKIARGEVGPNDPATLHAKATELASALDAVGLFDLLLRRRTNRAGHRELLDPFHIRMSVAYAMARQTRDFAAIDLMKERLAGAGVEVRMAKDGTVDLEPTSLFDPIKLEALL